MPAPADGWTLLFEDTFDGPLNPFRWSVYGPMWKGNAGMGWRDQSAVSVHDGMLDITARNGADGKVITGGAVPNIHQAYGRYEFSVRTDPDPSRTMSGVVLTWPDSENWPCDGENDMYETYLDEDPSNAFRNYSTFVHYDCQNSQVSLPHVGDAADWHVIAFEWEPARIALYVDGKLSGTITDPAKIPDAVHHMVIQHDAWKASLPAGVVLHQQVGYVRIYRR